MIGEPTLLASLDTGVVTAGEELEIERPTPGFCPSPVSDDLLGVPLIRLLDPAEFSTRIVVRS